VTRGRAAAALCVLGAIALPATRARADGPEPPGVESRQRSRIAILCVEGDSFGMRLAAELRELGFDALLIALEGEAASGASLEGSAREAGAVAALRVVPSGEGVEVWIADRGTGKTLLREIEDTGADPDPALVLRTVELLRATLLEISVPETPAAEAPSTAEGARELDVPPPRVIAARRGAPSEAPPLATLRFALAPGFFFSPGGFGPVPALGVGIDWRLSENAGFAVLGTIPLASAGIERPEGMVSLTVWTAGAAVRLFLAEPQSPWAPSIDLGALVLSVESVGYAEKGYVAGSSSAWAGAPFARVGLAHSLAPPVRVRTDLLVSALMQGVSVRVADREAATWGEPMVLLSLGVDAGWF
jgi:hypothetical protein